MLRVCVIGMGPIGNRHAEHLPGRPAGRTGRRVRHPHGAGRRGRGAAGRAGVLRRRRDARTPEPDMVQRRHRRRTSTAATTTSRPCRRSRPAATCCARNRSATRSRQAEEMVRAARARTGLCSGIDLNHRFTPAARLAKQWVDEGRLGHLLFVNMSMWIKNPTRELALVPDQGAAPAHRGHHALLLRRHRGRAVLRH